MALITKIEPIEDVLQVVADQSLSPQAQSRAIALFAQEQIEDASASNAAALGRMVPYQHWVDGRQGAPLESVHPQRGIITAEWELTLHLLRAIAQMLVDRSPIVKGDYLRGHRLFAGGIEVNAAGSIPEAEEYTFLNLVPYARKVEIGKTKSGRDFLIQVPNRIYERTAADAANRFGNIARIGFTYQSPLLPYIAGGKNREERAALRKQPARIAAMSIERASRVPAIWVRFR